MKRNHSANKPTIRKLVIYGIISMGVLAIVACFSFMLFFLSRNRSIQFGNLYIDTYGETIRKLRESQPDNLDLRFKRCRKPGPDYGTTIKKVEWTKNGTFKALVNIIANCGDDYWVGNYRVENETDLILKYTTFRGGGMAACLCLVQLKYRIYDLEMRDYEVTIQKTK